MPPRRSVERFGLFDRAELLELLAELVASLAIHALCLVPSSRLSNACGLAPKPSDFNKLCFVKVELVGERCNLCFLKHVLILSEIVLNVGLSHQYQKAKPGRRSEERFDLLLVLPIPHVFKLIENGHVGCF